MTSLTIKNDEVIAIAHRLALNTGESVVQTIKLALQEREARLYPKPKLKRDIVGARKLVDSLVLTLSEDDRKVDFNILYDENGLPK